MAMGRLSLEALAFSEALGRSLHQWRPVCRRCGRRVDSVSRALACDADELEVWFSCHGVSVMQRIKRDEVARLVDVWPTHVFEYEATSFGSWDANGSEVADA